MMDLEMERGTPEQTRGLQQPAYLPVEIDYDQAVWRAYLVCIEAGRMGTNAMTAFKVGVKTLHDMILTEWKDKQFNNEVDRILSLSWDGRSYQSTMVKWIEHSGAAYLPAKPWHVVFHAITELLHRRG